MSLKQTTDQEAMFPQNNEASGRRLTGMKLTDISVRLGLSVSTVSRALRNAEGVDRRTRSRVLAEATKVGYRGQNRHARFRDVDTRTVLVLSRSEAGGMHYEAMVGMSHAAIALNVSILSHQTPHDSPESILNPKWQPPAMRAGQLDGIVLLNEWPDSVVSELQRLHPVVSMLYDYPGCDVVAIDEVEGMRTLMAHLGRSGRVGYFGFCDGSTVYTRLHAAFETLRAGKIDSPVVEVSRESQAVPHASPARADDLRPHLKSGVRAWICPDVACADLLNLRAKSMGNSAAEPLVIGVFHPSGRQAAHTTHWTSLDIPAEELGIAAVRRLLHRIEHPSESIRRILLKAALSEGTSIPQQLIPVQPNSLP